MMYQCTIICWIFLLIISIVSSEDICPSPVAENIGTVHNTRERFEKLRKSVGDAGLSVKHVHHEHKGESYEYFVSFCGANNTAAIRQVEETKGAVKIVGKHDSASVLIGADDWLFIQYKNGQKYHSHCKGQNRQGWLSIRCEDRGEKPKLRVIEEARARSSDKTKTDKLCYYLFEYNHPAACSPKPKKPMSGGAVFCIIVLVAFSGYLVFGFLYQRFVLRASGLEQIPNYGFWRKFGNRLADGCDFVCRTEESNTNLYKGITDDLDMESSDEDRDEGLLPM